MPITANNAADVVQRIIESSVMKPASANVLVVFNPATSILTVTATYAPVDPPFEHSVTYTLAQLQTLTPSNIVTSVRNQLNNIYEQLAIKSVTPLVS